ncbi:MAG: hypothetical protein ACLUVG_17030 [Phocaeicola vulgatus]
MYKLIKSANDVLKTTTDDSKKEDRGQALGMRAFAYLTLVQMYQHHLCRSMKKCSCGTYCPRNYRARCIEQ